MDAHDLGNYWAIPEKKLVRGKSILPVGLDDFAEDVRDGDKLVVHKRDTDSVVMSVLSKFVERSKIGKKKYGTDLDRQDLSVLDWIVHAQEEHMDAILYLEKLKQEIQK